MAQTQTEGSEPRHSKGNLNYPGRDIDVDSLLRTHPLGRELQAVQRVEAVPEETQTEDVVPFDDILHGANATTLGKDFLDATDHRKPRPEVPIEKRLSIEAKASLKEIIWNFERVKKDLVTSKGQKLDKNPMVAGLALDEYLAFIELKLLNDEEFAYIQTTVGELRASLEETQQALLAEPVSPVEQAPVVEKQAPQSKLSVLERLEMLQGKERSGRFSPPKPEEEKT